MIISNIFKKDDIIAEFNLSQDKTLFITNYIKMLKNDINYKDFNYLDVFNVLFNDEEINREELLISLYSGNHLEILDLSQGIFQIEVALLSEPLSELNTNHKKDKKIIVNMDVYKSLDIDLTKFKNLKNAIKHLIPIADSPLIETIMNKISSKWTNLIDCQPLHLIYIYAKIIPNSQYLKDLLDNEKSLLNNSRELLFNLAKLNDIITELSIQKKFNVITSLLESPYCSINLKDLLIEYSSIKDSSVIKISSAKINSFHCIHAYISRIYRKIEANGENIVFPHNLMFTNLERLNNFPVKDTSYYLKLPKDKYELINWGENLNNCIASYNEHFLNLDCILIGVFDDSDKLKYALEYNSDEDKIVQFVGLNNEPVNQVFKQTILSILTNLKKEFHFTKRNFKYRIKNTLEYPTFNDSFLKNYGFIKNNTTDENTFFPEHWREYNLSDSRAGLILIDDKFNVSNKKRFNPININSFIQEIKTKKGITFSNNKNLFKLSKKDSFKRNLEPIDLYNIHREGIKYNKTIIIYIDLDKDYHKQLENYANLIIKIDKFHVTDDTFTTTVYPSLNTNELLVFENCLSHKFRA